MLLSSTFVAIVAASTASAANIPAAAPAPTTFYYSAYANTEYAFVTTARPTYVPGAGRPVSGVTTTLTMYVEPTVSVVLENYYYQDPDYFVRGEATKAIVGIAPSITPVADYVPFDLDTNSFHVARRGGSGIEPSVTLTFSLDHDYTIHFETFMPVLPAPSSTPDVTVTRTSTATVTVTASATTTTSAAIPYPTFAGCYAGAVDENAAPYPTDRPLSNQALLDRSGTFSVTDCKNACLAALFAFSAVQISTNNERYCWCGDAKPTTFAQNCGYEGGDVVGRADSYGVYQVAAASNTAPVYQSYSAFTTGFGSGTSSCYADPPAAGGVSFTADSFPFWAARSHEIDMTVGICTGACSLAGYKYAGIAGGKYCHCTNSDFTSNVADPSNCAAKCTGDNSETCGGAGYMTVYVGVPVVNVPVVPGVYPSYVGCFGGAIDGAASALPVGQPLPNLALLDKNGVFTVTDCQNACKTALFFYSAVQTTTSAGKFCWCGDALPTLPAADCAAGAGGIAGGVDSYAVYQVAAVNPAKGPVQPGNYFDPPSGIRCWHDLNEGVAGNFPYRMAMSSESSMTVGLCTAACALAGQRMAKLTRGQVRLHWLERRCD
ncbi:hypothetical protein HK101_002516 [Irineochytrium annulatum]|nr:hypothetical protein HK101_002516 [Irineochytrium annulatum]